MAKKLSATMILLLSLTSCGDDISSKDLGKMAITAGGAAGGALLGSKMVSPENKMMGMLAGGVAGGALGYLAGGALMKDK